jgi:superfamily II DNA or RNA helicase
MSSPYKKPQKNQHVFIKLNNGLYFIYNYKMKFRYDSEKEELIVSEATRIEYHQVSLWLTRHVKGYRYMPAFKMGVWNGQQSYFKNGRINLGLWKEAMRGCKEIETSFVLENKDDFPLNRDVTLQGVRDFCGDFFKTHKVRTKSGEWIPFIPYDHQIEAAYKILKNRYCMAEVATSGGKSLIISIVLFYTLNKIDPKAKFLIIVPSITLVTQFYDNIIEYNIGFNNILEMRDQKSDHILNTSHKPCDIRIEEVMSERPRKWSGTLDANVYIGTYQSLEKWPKEFFKQFHTVVTDEAHGAKAKTITTILGHTFKSAYSRFGVSGTFPEDDTCEILTIQSVLGPKITEVSANELKEKGIITPMDVKVVIMNHEDLEFDGRMTEIRRGGNGKDAFDLEKSYIHQSDKRLDFIKKIVDKCDSNTLLLFHTIEYGQKIFNKLKNELPNKDFYYIDGEVSGKKREVIKKEMENTDGKVRVLIASFGTLSTGVSINAIFNVIFTDSFKSEQIIIQSIGRALRLHDDKKKAIIFDLVDVFSSKEMSNILFRHFKEREKFYIKRGYPYKIIKVNI